MANNCSQTLAIQTLPSDGRLMCPACSTVFVGAATASPKAPQTPVGFDPYYQWLGIPPHDQPPTHYRLLGLVPFESNDNVIDSAANRQMAHLKTMTTGPQ